MGNLKTKNLYILILIALTLLISACGTTTGSKENTGDVFNVALDSIMEHDETLNTDMEFIAIHISTYEDLSENDEEEILSYFKDKYEVDVMFTSDTVQELKETDVYDTDTETLKGVFLGVDEVDFEDDENVFFRGSKFRSNTSGYELEFTVNYEDDKWQTSDIEELFRLMENPID